MHLLVCYDVVADKRRNKLFTRLKGFLRPVQKSVFEGYLPPQKWLTLLETIEDCLAPGEDTVRIYHLCGRCEGLITLLGTAEMVPEEPEDQIV